MLDFLCEPLEDLGLVLFMCLLVSRVPLHFFHDGRVQLEITRRGAAAVNRGDRLLDRLGHAAADRPRKIRKKMRESEFLKSRCQALGKEKCLEWRWILPLLLDEEDVDVRHQFLGEQNLLQQRRYLSQRSGNTSSLVCNLIDPKIERD